MVNHKQPVLKENERADRWLNTVNKNPSAITDEDIFFAKERYNLHQAIPDEGVNTEVLKKYFFKKYGF